MTELDSLKLSNPTIPIADIALFTASQFLVDTEAKLAIACHILTIVLFLFYVIMNAEKLWYRGRRLFNKELRKKPLIEPKEETEDLPE